MNVKIVDCWGVVWQVAAYTSGRRAVNKFDCLLLQHILWQRPDEAQRINDFLIDRLAADSSTQQTDYLFNGTHTVLCSLLPLMEPLQEGRRRGGCLQTPPAPDAKCTSHSML